MLNYPRWLDRLQVLERRYLTARRYLAILSLVMFLIGGMSYRIWLDYAPDEVQYSTSGKRKLIEELALQSQALASKNLALAIEQEANTTMQTMFSEQLVQQKALKKELAFYRSVMAPESDAEGVAIHDLQLVAGLTPERYQLRLILTQLQKRKLNVQGQALLTFIGIQDGKRKEYSLGQLTDKKFNFSFKFFQILETDISLPKGFLLARIKVNANVRAGRGNKAASMEQVFEAKDIFPDEKELGVILDQNSQVMDNSLNSKSER
jgi:hypothetical protein